MLYKKIYLGHRPRKETKMKKILSLIMVVALLSTCSIGMAFANETTAGGKTVPVELTVPAVSDSGIEFTISEKITMTAAANSTTLTVSDLVVENLKEVGVLDLTSVKVTAREGWTIKDNTADYFKTVKADTKEFGLSCGTHDFATAAELAFTDKQINPQGQQTVSFTGNIGTFTVAATTMVADVVATIAVY